MSFQLVFLCIMGYKPQSKQKTTNKLIKTKIDILVFLYKHKCFRSAKNIFNEKIKTNEEFYKKAGFKYKPDVITGMYLWIKK